MYYVLACYTHKLFVLKKSGRLQLRVFLKQIIHPATTMLPHPVNLSFECHIKWFISSSNRAVIFSKIM